jgi:long-chain acyl-CoA synthetase
MIMQENNSISFLLERFKKHKNTEAIIWNEKTYSYDWLYTRVGFYDGLIQQENIEAGSVVALKGDFTPNSIALFFALVKNNMIIVPLVSTVKNEIELLTISSAGFVFTVDGADEISLEKTGRTSAHTFYKCIRERQHPGLVLFSSGTSGEPKCAVHDFSKLLDKFHAQRTALRTLNFLLFDHWGGLNTMLHVVSNNGVVISTKDRSPRNICSLIEKYKIELLPASPTFLNLLLLSEVYSEFNLSSLRIISYGTEPMLPSTLQRLKILFPGVKLQQTYGLIELGVLRSKSESDESLWVKLGGEGYELRVVDGLLEIKAASAMLGYLNAPSPFTEDGWFKTGDAVEVQGEYFRILGRKSELINVGGEKVYPSEIETVIQEMPNIAEVMIYGEKSPIMGMIVVAKIRLFEEEDKKELISRIKKHCRQFLAPYKIPVKIIVDSEVQYGDRLKKTRVS